MHLAVIGLGKLGCPMAALLAAAGHDVVGADLSEAVVAAVNEGRAPVDETGLADLMEQASPLLRATTSVQEAAEDAELAFCIVPTPSLADATSIRAAPSPPSKPLAVDSPARTAVGGWQC